MAQPLRLLSYVTDGSIRPGIVLGEAVHDFQDWAGIAYSSIFGVLEDWPRSELEIRRAVEGAPQNPGRSIAAVQLAVPFQYPGTIFAAGANYHDHVDEMRRVMGKKDELYGHELGLPAWHFIKASRSCVVNSGATIPIPPGVTQLDWEAELAVVIGKPAYRVPISQALDYVAGYTIANDLSARNLMTRPRLADTAAMKFDWIGQKSFNGACPIGPWLTMSADVPDPQNLSIRLWVNEELKQDSHTSKMVYSVAQQIATLSERLTLQPGDVILTGSPSGVGLARREFLKPGDKVRIAIEGLGELLNEVS